MSQAAAKIAPAATATEADVARTDDAKAADGKVLNVTRSQGDLPLPMLLRKAAAEYNKPFNQLLTDFVKLGYGPGKLTIDEYFDYRLFDDAALAGADKRQFVGLTVMRALWDQVNFDRSWYGLLHDKLASTTLLAGYGFPVIPVEAIYATALTMPKPPCRLLATAEALRGFMHEPANYPMFGKPMDGLQSLGSMSIDSLDAATGTLTLVDGSKVALDTFIDDVTTHYAGGYLLQKRLSPHAEIRAICGDRLATVRLVTINAKTGPEILRTCWKIPAGANAADNFWRAGNLLGTLDVDSGRVVRVIRGAGMDQVSLEAHPDTGTQMVGFDMPMWAEAKALVLAGAGIFPSMGMIGWDIAITDAGPVIVEPNETPDHGLPQIADRRGMLDDRFRAFLAERKALQTSMQQNTRRLMQEETRRKTQKVAEGMTKG